MLVLLRLVQRRWLRSREAAVRRTLRAGIGGSLALAAVGSLLPLLAVLVRPEVFERNLEVISIAAWVVSGALAGLVWGGLQGVVSGGVVSLVDVVWASRSPSFWRFVIAGGGGLVFSFFFIIFSSAGLFSPPSPPAVYAPVFLLYGFLQGGALSWVIPRLGQRYPQGLLTLKCLQASITIGLVALPMIYLVYHEFLLTRLPIDWLYALLMPAGLALATNRD